MVRLHRKWKSGWPHICRGCKPCNHLATGIEDKDLPEEKSISDCYLGLPSNKSKTQALSQSQDEMLCHYLLFPKLWVHRFLDNQVLGIFSLPFRYKHLDSNCNPHKENNLYQMVSKDNIQLLHQNHRRNSPSLDSQSPIAFNFLSHECLWFQFHSNLIYLAILVSTKLAVLKRKCKYSLSISDASAIKVVPIKGIRE